MSRCTIWHELITVFNANNRLTSVTGTYQINGRPIIIIIIGCTALGRPWPPQTNVASDLYPGHPPANFSNTVSLCLPPPSQSIFISVGHVLGDLQGLWTKSF